MLAELNEKYSHWRLLADPYAEFLKSAKTIPLQDEEVIHFLEKEGGTCFSDGLYRTHTPGSSCFWTLVIESCFPKYKNKIHCFAFDWLGRLYAKGLTNNLIYMFDGATVTDYEMKINLKEFHSVEIRNYSIEILNEDHFTNWMNKYGRALNFSECVGFITPLFLGGEDDYYNYEIVDIEMNWEVSLQLYNQIQGLPENTIIDKIKLNLK